MNLTENRKQELQSYSLAYSSEFQLANGLPDLNEIAISEHIVLIEANYNNSFEGLTVFDNGRFFIHIDTGSVIGMNLKRKRFTLAHELGHSLISKHRKGLIYGLLKPHTSHYLLGNDGNEIELEADYFASCLLMPESIYKSQCIEFVDQFSFSIIDVLSAYFSTSWFATLLRYSEVGTIPVFLSFCRDGNVCWYKSGSQFPDWAFKFKVHQSVPTNTLISDVFEKGIDFIGEIREVDRDDWFHVYNDDYGTYDLFEQCYYLKSYDYIVSMLWFEKQK